MPSLKQIGLAIDDLKNDSAFWWKMACLCFFDAEPFTQHRDELATRCNTDYQLDTHSLVSLVFNPVSKQKGGIVEGVLVSVSKRQGEHQNSVAPEKKKKNDELKATNQKTTYA